MLDLEGGEAGPESSAILLWIQETRQVTTLLLAAVRLQLSSIYTCAHYVILAGLQKLSHLDRHFRSSIKKMYDTNHPRDVLEVRAIVLIQRFQLRLVKCH